ncbi:MAG: SPOR domain-containing protein [Nitrospiraceae bacterium]|nr:SPOR domain-containing protein [Nitrospiraceae bacterium]
MNVNSPECSGSPRILGKEFLIVLVVICSSLSFTAGYFVGRNNPDQRPGTAARVADIPSAQSKPEDPQPLQPQTADQPREAATQPVQRATEMPAEKTVVPKKTADQKGSGQTAGGESGREAKKAVTSDSEIYTVQLAALKNPAEARRLKEKMTKKGFKVQIIAAKNKKNEKIYKIRTGEFREKKDADILALKLKKNEGLNTFVSLKNE